MVDLGLTMLVVFVVADARFAKDTYVSVVENVGF